MSQSQTPWSGALVAVATGVTLAFLAYFFPREGQIGNTPLPSPSSPPATPEQALTFTFPQQQCGDPMPAASPANPVTIYRVLVDYTPYTLDKVKTEFCRDAWTLRTRPQIQVASFTDAERANSFKRVMQEKVGSGRIEQALYTGASP